MAIRLLDSNTINKIAAGEVIERPSSIVKELCENSIDAACTAITCEIKDGGTSYIRITDNGKGIHKEDIQIAFLRHATSKISSVEDLSHIYSLGFRGEALSSICAVAKVEMVTKTKEAVTGIQYIIEGGKEISNNEVGVPDGTTVIVRSLFFNIPARRKFLKSKLSETAAITEVVQNLALSHPDISFRYIIDNKEKFHTSGNCNLKDLIYRIYGRDIAREVKEIDFSEGDICIKGMIGSPHVGRGTRSFETSFVNNRYVISDVIYKSVEEAYKLYLMQHKFPFFVINITVPADTIDINVHPAKREIKFLDADRVYDFIYDAVRKVLSEREMLKSISLVDDYEENRQNGNNSIKGNDFSEDSVHGDIVTKAVVPEDAATKAAVSEYAVLGDTVSGNTVPCDRFSGDTIPAEISEVNIINSTAIGNGESNIEKEEFLSTFDMDFEEDTFTETKPPVKLDISEEIFVPTEIKDVKQLDLFEEKIISRENQKEYEIIGQIFDTYWLFRYKNELLIMDQHAAHEKIKYEHLIEQFKNKEILSQNLLPSMVMRLSSREMDCYRRYARYFAELGFVSEEYGDDEINVRSVPLDLYDANAKDLFLSILDELLTNPLKGSPEIIHSKLATTACKSAVKGNNAMSIEQADALIGQLLTLENPYHCPHGRPTVITISKQELEKKFSRIV